VRVMQERDTARDETAALKSKRDASSRQQVSVSGRGGCQSSSQP